MKKFMRKAVAMICMLSISVGSAGMVVCATGENQQKSEYYEQYKKIVEEVSSDTDVELTLLSAEDFADEDWRTPDEFEKIVRAFATAEIAVDKNDDIADLVSETRYAVAASKNVSFTVEDTADIMIKIKADFSTQYHAERQYISMVSNISSSKATDTGTWQQTGSNYLLIDAGRTAQISVSGNLSYGGVSQEKIITVEFYCGATGGVS